MTKAERAHLARVKSLPCGVCSAPPPSYAHHIREGQGASQRAGHYLTVPLCYDCHQGPHGIHGDRSLWRIYNCTELDVLNTTFRLLAEERAPCPSF
jgi:hypothetical protein